MADLLLPQLQNGIYSSNKLPTPRAHAILDNHLVHWNSKSSNHISQMSNTKPPSQSNKKNKDHDASHPTSQSTSGPSFVTSNSGSNQKEVETVKSLDTLCPAVTRMGYTSNPNETIGEGAFSRVYRARSTKIPNRDIAVKIVRVNDTNIPQAWKEYSMKRELKILKRVQHPNVITVYDVIKTRTRIYIFMDLAPTSVSSHLAATEEPASEQTARNWFGGISNAIAYLHQIEIAHRDLKNDNILIDSNGIAKLTDFGFACFTIDKKTKAEILSKTSCGTKAYVAPEVFNPPYNPKSADVWSLGVCLFECVTLMLPFRDDLPLQVYIRHQMEKGLVIPKRWQSKLDVLLQDLMKRMIEPDVNKRPKSEAVLIHPWMRMPRR